MKKTISILIVLFLLTACNRKNSETVSPKVDTISIVSDSLKNTKNYKERKMVEDSLIFYSDSLYSDLEINFTEISKNEFQLYKRKYKTQCILDSGHVISGSEIYVSRDCKEICETYLREKTTNRKMVLPSNYDSGILTMSLSPTCNQMIVCSSYDGPDYVDYYEDRAEIFVFNVTNGIGLKGIKPTFKYYTKDWSIEDLTWINDKTIALKVYEEQRWGDGSGVHYKYLKADLINKKTSYNSRFKQLRIWL